MSGAFKVVSLRPEERFTRIKPTVPPGLEIIHCADTDEEAVAEACKDADAILGMTPVRITARVIERAARLKFIQQGTAGYDRVDIEAAAARGIPVSNTGDANSSSVAEYVILTALMITRKIKDTEAGFWGGTFNQTRHGLGTSMFELRDRTIGIIGLGRVGRQTAKRALGFDMRVLYYDIVRPTAEEEQQMDVHFVPFEEVLCSSDVVTLHVPLTPLTRNMISTEQFAMMKSNAVFINASRGEVVDERALVEVLKSGKLAGAAMDVFHQEPTPPDHPYVSLPDDVKRRFIATPHVAGVTRDSYYRMLQYSLDNIARVAQGLKPLFVVNGVE